MSEIKVNSLFYLTQYIKTSWFQHVINTSDYEGDTLVFFILYLQSPTNSLHLQLISIQTSHVPQWPLVATGHYRTVQLYTLQSSGAESCSHSLHNTKWCLNSEFVSPLNPGMVAQDFPAWISLGCPLTPLLYGLTALFQAMEQIQKGGTRPVPGTVKHPRLPNPWQHHPPWDSCYGYFL